MANNPITNPLIVDTEARNSSTTLQPKVIYAGDIWNNQPYIAVQGDTINVTASKTNACIALNDKFGITLGGQISFSMMPDQISIGGGYWRFNPLLLSCLSSTTPTPVPILVKATPRLLTAASDISNAKSILIVNSDVA